MHANACIQAHLSMEPFSSKLEKACRLHVHTHGSKHNGKVTLVPINNALRLLHQTSVTTDLTCNLYKRPGERERERLKE